MGTSPAGSVVLVARGTSLLYVHRGTGFCGFPPRVGVSGEAPVLEVMRR